VFYTLSRIGMRHHNTLWLSLRDVVTQPRFWCHSCGFQCRILCMNFVEWVE
jgi:hypothetical protein